MGPYNSTFIIQELKFKNFLRCPTNYDEQRQFTRIFGSLTLALKPGALIFKNLCISCLKITALGNIFSTITSLLELRHWLKMRSKTFSAYLK